VAVTLILSCGVFAAGKPAPKVEYLDNGTIKIGVDLSIGGSITYLADSKALANSVNSHDWGRQIQQSYYSGPVPYGKPAEAWKTLGWNPVQSGDFYNNTATILDFRRETNLLYIKTRPMHWPLNNVPGECTFETWIELEKNTARVRCRLTNDRPDQTQYPGRAQELPAVYTTGTYWKLITYCGAEPFTGAALERIPKKPAGASFPWSRFLATECWAALVNDADWGVGIFTPGTMAYLGGFNGKENSGGDKDASCGYIAPLQDEIIDHNIVYNYTFTLMVGHLTEIRDYAYAQKSPTAPDYSFRKDRQHWTFENASDGGWPVAGKWRIALKKPHAQLKGPRTFWKAAQVPTLYIRASSRSSGAKSRLFWRCHGDEEFSENRVTSFDLIPDGTMRNYAIPLSANKTYTGAMTQLRFDPGSTGQDKDFIEIEYIGWKNPD